MGRFSLCQKSPHTGPSRIRWGILTCPWMLASASSPSMAVFLRFQFFPESCVLGMCGFDQRLDFRRIAARMAGFDLFPIFHDFLVVLLDITQGFLDLGHF